MRPLLSIVELPHTSRSISARVDNSFEASFHSPGRVSPVNHLLKDILRLLRPYWVAVSFVFFSLAVQMSFRLALPFSFQLIFDRAIPQQDTRFFLNLMASLVVWWIIQALFSMAQDIQASRVGITVINNLRIEMFRNIRFLPADHLSKIRSGDLLSRFSVDLMAIEKVVIHSIYVLAFSLINVLASLLLLFYIEWRLALLTLTGMIFSALAPKRLSKKAEKANYERKGQDGKVGTFIQETLGTLDVIHAFNLWRFQQQKFAARIETLSAEANRANTLSAVVHRLGSQSAYLLQVAIVGFGGYLVIQGGLTVGTLVAFLALLQNMVGGISHLSSALPDMFQGAGAMQRVREFLSMDGPASENETKKPLARLAQSLTFNEVSFQYEDGKTVLDKLSFQIKSGQSVAVVGSSGSGKSTLLKLILRFHDPDSGSIQWDGGDLLGFSKESLREQVSVVPQDSVLFSTSIRDNIRMGRLEANDEDIDAATKKAGIHDSIMAMPKGIDSLVGERGSQLSGGQRQRVAIARALLRNPSLLILDEATSALDPVTETAVNDTLRRVEKSRTLISITHRLHSVTHADSILVLNGGRLVQQGRHETLVNEDGLYADLWRKQAGFKVSCDGLRAECESDRLKLIPLFHELGEAPLSRIADQLVSEYYPKDRIVFMKGDYGDKFFIIVNGQVEVSDMSASKDSGEMMTLDSGDFFGELALLDRISRSASIKTLMPTLFLTLSKPHFEGFMEEFPQIRAAIESVAQNRRNEEGP